MSDFGQTLRQYRLAARLSQPKLAEAAGMDHSYISRLEHGNRMPTHLAVMRLAGALKLSQADREALYIDAGFIPEGYSLPRLKYPQLAQLDKALVTSPDPEAIADALASVRFLIQGLKALGSTITP